VSDALARLAESLGDGDSFLREVAGPFRRAVRVHPRRGAFGGWRETTVVPWSPAGRFHAADQDPGRNLDYHTGTVYPQDAASQLPALLLDAQPGEVVVDSCAAPGSKSTQLGLALGDDGLLVCCDRSSPRRKALIENLSRQGVACAVVTPMAPEDLAARHPGAADAVLVDAPCSGHEPRSVRQVERMAERQHALIADCARLVRPGGRLVYSTCTPYREEDEGVIARFLSTHPGWQAEPLVLPGCDADLDGLGALRLWPQRQGTEPFFACRLRSPGADLATGFVGRSPSVSPELSRWLPDSSLTCWRRGAALLAATSQAAACSLPSEARGVLLGRGEGDRLRLEPWGAQALIERGVHCVTVSRAHALELWAGRAIGGLPEGAMVRTEAGAPLGIVRGEGRLDLPSRMCRDGLE
jgi:16S rRNA C967 or C1407 C5-methylase (RsmB/RsmF family)